MRKPKERLSDWKQTCEQTRFRFQSKGKGIQVSKEVPQSRSNEMKMVRTWGMRSSDVHGSRLSVNLATRREASKIEIVSCFDSSS